jgi:hypothetical protein
MAARPSPSSGLPPVDFSKLDPDEAAALIEALIQAGRVQEAQQVLEWLRKRRQEHP